jgi:hypothetical protein
MPEARFAGSRGWVRPDGKAFLDTMTTPTTSAISPEFYPPCLDEYGTPVLAAAGQAPGNDQWVMTGEPGAAGIPVLTCNDWTSNDQSQVLVGLSSAGGGGWAAWSVGRCDSPARIYCGEVGKTLPALPETVPSRHAFVTIGGPLFLSTGPNFADQECADEAARAGLSGTFKALVANIGQSAASRFADGLPWARMDGVVVATYAQLSSGAALNAPIHLGPNGLFELWARRLMFSGAPDAKTPGTRESTCNGWTPPYDTLSVAYGARQESERGFLFYGEDSCTNDFGAYCLEE